MKKLLIVAGLAVLASCGGKTVYVVDSLPEDSVVQTDAPQTTPAPSRPPASTYPASGTSGYSESAFFDAVRQTAPTVYSLMPDSDILNMGLIICETLDSGASIQDVTVMIVKAMANTGTGRYAEEIAGITAATLLHLCPEHSWWLETL